MAIIYSYPKVTTPLATDVLVLTDTTLRAGKRKNQTKSLAMSDLAAYVISSTSAITGSGTLNTIPLFTPSGVKLGDSLLRQDANDIVYVGPDDSVRFTGTTINAPVILGTDLFVSNITSGQTGVVTIRGNAIIGDQVTDTLIVNSTVTINNQLIDGTGSPGTAGQVLSSTGTQIEWINNTNANTTYNLFGATSNVNEYAISLSGSDGSLDKVNLIPGSNITLTSSATGVTIDAADSTSALTAETIVQPIIADGALVKGDPVYITGFNNGQNKNIVAKADSSDPAKMPVVGISDGAYANNGAGFMTAFGSFNGTFDTTGGAENWSVGDIIYVKPGGGLTNIKPGGTDLIQNIAIVSRVQQNTGELEVIALGRANDVPNPLVVNNALQRLGIRGNPERELDVFGGVRVRGTLDLFQGNDNTFAGTEAGNLFNIIGSTNTGFGENTQAAQSTGQSNASLGFDSLMASVTGNNNTAIGTGSMKVSNGGSFNTALGSASLSTATLGQGNTAIGFSALADKTNTNFNTAVGNNCLGKITTGFRNTAIGNDAGRFTSDGVTSNSTGNQSIFIGDSAKALANAQNNQIVIGYDAIGNGANTATIGNSSIVKTILKGNVGIGTTSPNAASILHLVDTDPQLRIQEAGNTAFSRIFTGANNALRFGVGTTGQTRMTILSSDGNVGIGTTTPASKLHVSGGDIRIDDTERIEFGAGGVRINNDAAGRMYYNAPLGYYWQAGSGYKMVLLDSGNVGIGTTSPGARLEVQGGATLSAVAFSGPTVKIGDYSGIGNTRIFSNGSYIGYSTTNSYHDFSNAGSSQMRITSSGNVGIGTTSPASKLEVAGGDIEVDDSASGLILKSANGSRWRQTISNTGVPVYTQV